MSIPVKHCPFCSDSRMKYDLFDKNAPVWVCLYCSHIIRATPEPDHCNSQVNLPDSYWTYSLPFFVENWSSELRALLGDVSFVPLEDIGSLRTAIRELTLRDTEGICLDNDIVDQFSDLERKFDLVARTYQGAFLKTSLRSPKDSEYAKKRHFKVVSGRDALHFILDSRERLYDDFALFQKYDYTPQAVFQKWVYTPKWSEFRCFVKDRKLIGISQNNHHGLPYYTIIHKHNEAIREAIEEFFYKEYLPVVHVDDSVFEVSVRRNPKDRMKWRARFIEVNPFASTTDTCLFSWKDDLSDFDGSFRYVTEESKERSMQEKFDFLERMLSAKG
jgi:hypothetical protein